VSPGFRPEAILEVLERQHVRYVLIGRFAATIHGSPHVTTGVDITPAETPENLARLSAALEELEARIRVAGEPDGLAFSYDAGSLARGRVWSLTTRLGTSISRSFLREPMGTTTSDERLLTSRSSGCTFPWPLSPTSCVPNRPPIARRTG